jgi:hypothetical protein
MNTPTGINPYESLRLWKRIAKGLLAGLNFLLPRKVYHAIYFPSYEFYRWMLRQDYRRHLKCARKAGDERAVRRMERVLSVMPFSLISPAGLEHTHDLATDVLERNVAGCFVECGIAAGGCAALIAKIANSTSPPRACWFFDSYEGLPDPTANDFQEGVTGGHIRPLPRGSCLGTYEQVSHLLFETMSLPRERIRLVKGWFQDTLVAKASTVGPIALLRIDGDWYESTKCCLESLYDQVTPGGHVIIDDYWSCHGAHKATNEFLEKRQIITKIISDGRGGCSFQRPVGDSNVTGVRAA